MDFTQYTIEDFVCDQSFQNYFLGNHATDVSFWEDYEQNHPEQVEAMEAAKKMLSILTAKQGNIENQRAQLQDGLLRFTQLQEQLNQNAETPAFPLKSRNTTFFKYAAAVTAVGLFSLITYTALRSKTIPPTEAISIIKSDSNPRKTIVLADGTVVTLRNNSRLTIAENFNAKTRELVLDGEAFFDVKPDSLRPFIVHTQTIDIKVLGTIFNVNAYNNQSLTETALFRGKIEVNVRNNPGQHIVLIPNQKLVLNNAVTNEASKADTAKSYRIVPLKQDPISNKASEIAWVRNRIEIENETLETIATKLGGWYGISIFFSDDAVKKYSYSGTFESETILKALEALQLSYPFSFQVQKDTIVIGK